MPWTYLFLIACLGLLALGIVWYIEHLNRRFSALNTAIEVGLAKEGQSRGAAHSVAMQSDELLEKRLTDRIKQLEDSIRALKPSPAAEQETVALPDRIRMFSKELAAYLSNRMARPDEEEIWRKYGSPFSEVSSATQFSQKYNETVQLWDDKLAAGYWLEYAERATALRHELVLKRGADAQLDQLLSGLEGPVKGEHPELMQKLVERFRLLASQAD
jgi:hypothetical protein